MAQRRMFSLKIVDTDAFLDMPQSSQLLYFHFNMRADDEGFVGNPKKIMRMVGASDDDLKVLLAKRFILSFESGVVVIKHWLIHNTIRMDRFSPTTYKEEKNLLEVKENKSYTENKELRQPNGNQVETQVKLSEVKLSKDNLIKDKILATPEVVAEEKINLNPLIELFKEINPSYKKLYSNTTQRSCLERIIKENGLDQVKWILEMLPKTNTMQYWPIITTPQQLENKIGQLKAKFLQEKNKFNQNKITKI